MCVCGVCCVCVVCVVCACVMQEVQCLTVSLSVLLLVYIQSAFGSCEVTMIREVGGRGL